MGHYEHNHQAADGLLNLFTKANHELNAVQNKLEREFQQTYPDNANPVNLVSRIKKIQGDVSNLKEQCLEILAAKQDLIDKARANLVGNRNLLQNMQVSTGIPLTSGSEDPAFVNFNQNDILEICQSAIVASYRGFHMQIIDEWTAQVKSVAGNESLNVESEDINQLLFSSIVQNN